MKHYVFKRVLFTLCKEYEGDTAPFKYYYVSCQWRNANKEVCDVEIIAESEAIEQAFEGNTVARVEIYSNLTYYLMLSFNPSIIS